jgi:urocanate hydratase
MPDGSDAVSDWPRLDALLTCASGADLVAIHGGGGGYAGYYQSAGLTVVADGSAAAAERIAAALDADTGLGILRYADAGCEDAGAAARAHGLGCPDPRAASRRSGPGGLGRPRRRRRIGQGMQDVERPAQVEPLPGPVR